MPRTFLASNGDPWTAVRTTAMAVGGDHCSEPFPRLRFYGPDGERRECIARDGRSPDDMSDDELRARWEHAPDW